jgi:hypothetical protein
MMDPPLYLSEPTRINTASPAQFLFVYLSLIRISSSLFPTQSEK